MIGKNKIVFLYNEYEGMTFHLRKSSITNKIEIITDFIKEVAINVDGFEKWLIDFLGEYKNSNRDINIVMKNIDVIKKFCDIYIENKNMDFSRFVDESKTKKNSIFFVESEIKDIIRVSSYLKIYSLIFNSTNFSLSDTGHKMVYNEFISEIVEKGIVQKIFTVIRTKTFRYNITDRYMWEYIKNVEYKDAESYVVEIFNFIMNHIIILCQEDRNPITFFVSVIDDSIRWFLRSVFKDNILYQDTISTEDAYGLGKDNLKTYGYNDTLSRLIDISVNRIYIKLKSDEKVLDFKDRLSGVKHISPMIEIVSYPILSKILNIPYSHFSVISPENAVLLSYVTSVLIKEGFDKKFLNICKILEHYPESQISLITTYRVKGVGNICDLFREGGNFIGFKILSIPLNVLSFFIGRMSRVEYINIITGERMGSIPLNSIEGELLEFYIPFFTGGYKKETKIMKNFLYENI